MALFPISLEVEDPAVGSVLRILHNLAGVAKVHIDFDHITGKRGLANLGKRGAPDKKLGGPTTRQIILAALISGPKNLRFLEEELRKHNLASSGVSTMLYEMKRHGLTKRVAPGVHGLTERALAQIKQKPPTVTDVVHALPAPGKHTKQAKSNGKAQHHRAKGQSQLSVIRALTALGGKAERKDIVDHLGSGWSTRAVDQALYRCRKIGQIARAADGVYELTARGAERAKTKEG